MRRTVRGLVAAAVLACAAPAGAATLIGDYQLQGTRASNGPGAALTDLGAGANSFQTDTVMGVSRQVLAFPQHNGLRLNPTGTTGSTYSVVATFRLADVSSYKRFLDSTNGTSDSGFYSHTGMADYYDNGNDYESPSAVLFNNTYATVAITQLYPPASALSSIYVNGVLAAQHGTAYPVLGDTLRFFKDDGAVEESAGAVSCIRVFSGALTAAEVSAIGASATCAVPALPPLEGTGFHKKCKKHKKKHRSAESAKKKCKKHKKR
jgi:hypothetical protein